MLASVWFFWQTDLKTQLCLPTIADPMSIHTLGEVDTAAVKPVMFVVHLPFISHFWQDNKIAKLNGTNNAIE